MANPIKNDALLADRNGKPLMSTQSVNTPTLDITWTANEPTAASTQTIADGTVPTVAELGQAVANLTAKMNVMIAVLEQHGLQADS